MKTKWWAILLVVFSTLINVGAQTSYKYAAPMFALSLQGTIFNIPLLIGISLYAISAACLILGFRGGDLSTLFPLVSLTFVWVTIIAWLVLKETITLTNILGMVVILAGVLIITIGGKK
jgi:drug/metabolite transporter (DMT)-like permease